MKNEQYRNNETFRLVKEIQTDVSIKENGTLDEKKRSEPRHNSKETRTKIIISNI